MTKPKLSAAAEPLVLGIESSCDETGIGIVRGTRLLTNTVSSSMEEHVRFGGVIPEIASRAHLDAMIPALEAALADAHVTLDDIDAIAVTAGPGLAGALMGRCFCRERRWLPLPESRSTALTTWWRM